MKRITVMATAPVDDLLAEAAKQRYCENCGDPFDDDFPVERYRDYPRCPNPSPGKPLVDCGVGGHMFRDAAPGIN